MNGYIITTAYGKRYKTDEHGYVLEHSNGLKENRNSESRKTWQLTGAWFYIGFGHVRTVELESLIGENLNLKNGKPKYGLCDIDHGIHRMTGNKDYHGIATIQVY